MESLGSGWKRGVPEREGCRKAVGGGKRTQPPKHWMLSQRSRWAGLGGTGLQDWSGRSRGGPGSSSLSLSLSGSSTGKSAPRTKHASAQGRRRGPAEATSAAGTRPGVPFAGALWVWPGLGAPLRVCRACPSLAGQAALAPREVAGRAGGSHLG